MEHNLVVDALSRIGIARLSDALGDQRLTRLAELGVPMRPKTIADAAFQEQGFELFRNKSLRIGILNSFTEEKLRNTFNIKDDEISVQKLNEFKWGMNDTTALFLSLFGIELTAAFPDRKEIAGFQSSTNISKPLFDYQNSIRKQLNSFLSKRKNKRIIAHMPTGSGKTRTTMELISDFIRTRTEADPTLVVWMAHSDELCEQAAQTFTETWEKLGSEDAIIYRLWGGRPQQKLDFSKPIFLITSFQTCFAAMMSRHDKRFEIMSNLRNECDLLVVDEAHMSTAPTYKSAIEFLCNENTQLIGLTATPGRHHVGGDTEGTKGLATFYENNKITLGNEILDGTSPIEFLQSRGILSKVDRYELPTNIDIKLSPKRAQAVSELLELPKDILKELGDNAQRTMLVASHALVLTVEQKKQTIIFCPSKENASAKLQRLKTYIYNIPYKRENQVNCN